MTGTEQETSSGRRVNRSLPTLLRMASSRGVADDDMAAKGREALDEKPRAYLRSIGKET